MNKKHLSIVIVLFLALSACYGLSNDSTPDIGIPKDDINKDIALYIPQPVNTYKIGNWITIAIRNIGEKKVWLSNDEGIKIFAYFDKQWIEVQNIADYSGLTGRTIVPYQNNPANELTIGCLPDLTNNSEPIKLRIYIIGNIMEGDSITDNNTGASIDIQLNP
jgi:hypothetical protein